MGKINTGGVNKIVGDVVNVANSVTGTTLKLTPPKGYYDGSTGKVTIADANFVASKIIAPNNLFGIVGTAYNWSPNPIGAGFSATATMISQTSNISEGSLWRTEGNFQTNASSFSGVTNGFFYTSEASTNTRFAFLSGSFGVGNSGLYLYSSTTGEEILIISANSQTLNTTTIRSISLVRLNNTTIRVHSSMLPSGSSSASTFTGGERTISSNFFNGNINFRMRIGTCYSNSASSVFQADINMSGYMVKF